MVLVLYPFELVAAAAAPTPLVTITSEDARTNTPLKFLSGVAERFTEAEILLAIPLLPVPEVYCPPQM
jgi:hypothetical protein